MSGVADGPARTWGTALPWLTGPVGQSVAELSNDDASSENLREIIDAVVTSWRMCPLGTLFPAIDQKVVLRTLTIGQRMINAFGREGRVTFADISNESVETIASWRAVGATSVEELVRALLQGVLSPVPIPEIVTSGESPWARTMMTDFVTLSRWRSLLGRNSDALLAQGDTVFEPPEVAAARARLLALSADEVLNGAEVSTVSGLVNELVSDLDVRRAEILRRRVFADVPDTLEKMAISLGLTRERVRQLETNTKYRLSRGIRVGLLGSFSNEVARQIAGVTSLELLVQTMPSLEDRVESVGQPLWRVVDRLDNSFEIRDGWCAAPSVTEAVVRTRASIASLAGSSTHVVLEDARISMTDVLADSDRLLEWLEYCGYEVLDRFVLMGSGGIADRAHVVLLEAGEPLDAEDLLSRIGVERSINSLKNALTTDKRFDRVNRSAWGLAEWGLEKYRSIRELIRQEVDAADGSIAVNELIDRITRQFSVSARSVIAYSSAPPFRTQNGAVTLASGGPIRGRSPYATQRVFRRDGAWLYRTVVTVDHARGSGSMLPTGIASALGLDFGQTRSIESRLGPQSVAWVSPQVTVGSIRRFVQDDLLEVGTAIFLCFGDDGIFDVECLAEPADLMESILSLAGVRRDAAASAMGQLALAIGAPTESGIADLIAALHRRGDHDIAELLEGA